MKGTYGLEDGVVELEVAAVERAGDAEQRAGSEMAALGVVEGWGTHTEPGAERGHVARGGGERCGVVPLVQLLEEPLVHDPQRAALHSHARVVPRAVHWGSELQEGRRAPPWLGRGRLPLSRRRRHCCDAVGWGGAAAESRRLRSTVLAKNKERVA